VSASQGVLPGWGDNGAQADGSWDEAALALEDEWAGVAVSAGEAATAEATPGSTVIYVDKEPIVITKEIVVRSKQPAPVAATRTPDVPAAAPTSSATPGGTPPGAPAAAPSSDRSPSPGGGGEAPAGFSPQAAGPAAPSPTATMAPRPAAPVETLASGGGPAATSWGDDGQEDEEDEDEHDDEDKHEDEDDYHEDHD